MPIHIPPILYLALPGIVIIILFKKYWSRMMGYFGESGVKNKLAALDSKRYIILNDIYLPNSKGGTSQIDHVVVSKYGIFVIETKNYSGQIYGKETDQYWTVVNYKRKDKLKNPFHQNYGHLQAIKEAVAINAELPFISMVVFTTSAELKVQVKPGTELLTTTELVKAIQKYNKPLLSADIANRIVAKLNSVQVIDKGTRQKHVQSIKSTIAKQRDSVKKGVCPRCGGQLVKRNGKYGSFTGCSNFPRCRFVQKR